VSDTYACLLTGADEDAPTIVLTAAESEAMLTTGYSPHLHFDIEDMDSTIVELLQMGAHLDGAIKHEDHGRVAAVRSPDGHMIGLYEPNEA